MQNISFKHVAANLLQNQLRALFKIKVAVATMYMIYNVVFFGVIVISICQNVNNIFVSTKG